MNFADRVCAAVRAKASVVTVGLDPTLSLMPAPLADKGRWSPQAAAEAIFDFNRLIIDSVSDLAVAVKPQLAYFEAYGSAGMAALEKSTRSASEAGLLVICDAKRNDIGPTAGAYAAAFLERRAGDGWGVFCDALTVNPYLGADGLMPFVNVAAANDKGVFVLVKTSNPSSVEIQDLPTEGGFVYEAVASRVAALAHALIGQSGYSLVGAVVGATFPETGAALRGILPHCIFLVPGFGFQGGTAGDIRPYLARDGLGALVSSSRGVIGIAADCTSLREAGRMIRRQAERMRDSINDVLAKGTHA